MAVSLTTAQVIYAAQTKILELADEVAESASINRVWDKIELGERLIRYIRALHTDDTLTFEEQQAICQCMISLGNLYDFPASPTITSDQEYNFAANIILQGEQGPPGRDGGGTDYNQFDLINNSIVDSFPVTSANGADWTYVITDGTNLRRGTITAGWLTDGSNVVYYDQSTIDIGNTSAIELSVTYLSGEIRLLATITSGSWDVRGTRYFTPNNGAGTGIVSSVLPNGRIFIGNASNVAESQSVTGDIGITNGGVVSITANSIVNADINSSAAIAVNKLAPLTASRAVVSDSSGFLTTSTATATEVGYLSGVTSGIQAQLDSKIGSVTGAISTVVSSNLTVNRAVISDPSGKIAVSGVTSTELGYLSGATSNIQDQINDFGTDGTYTSSGIVMGSGFSNTNLEIKQTSRGSIIINGGVNRPSLSITDSGTDLVVFTLPIGYRPSVKKYAMGWYQALGSSPVGDPFPFEINTSGTVVQRIIQNGSTALYNINFNRIEFDL